MPTIHITVSISNYDKWEGNAKESVFIPDEHMEHLKPGLAQGTFEKLVAEAIQNYHKRNKEIS